MTKWFDTNYHYLVPQPHRAGTAFRPDREPPSWRMLQAKRRRCWASETRPVLLGPVSFLLLSKTADGSDAAGTAARHLLPVYVASAAANWREAGRGLGADG